MNFTVSETTVKANGRKVTKTLYKSADLDKTSTTTIFLEKMFKDLNAEYFGGQLDEPIITVQSTKGAYGHVSVDKIWHSKNSTRHELNMGAGTLDRPITQIAATMVHEMVHLYCIANGIQDTSRGNTYHNKRFKTEAEKRGLHIEQIPKHGWTKTSPADDLVSFVETQKWNDIQMARHEQTEEKTKRPKSKSSTRKYECPCCGLSVRATKVVGIMCMECEEQLIEI